MNFVPLFSGSSGNALLIEMQGERILVDAGVSGARIIAEMDSVGEAAEDLSALLITHEHADHVAGAGVMSRKFDLPVYATEGTWREMDKKIGRIEQRNRRVLRAGQDFYIGRINVMPFEIPHDAAEPVGYAFAAGGVKWAVATDIGQLKESWLRQVEGAETLLLEANHDIDMLKAGRYPYELKRRILGSRGHLSNEDAGTAAAELAARGVRHIILGHLSGENNFPELAWQAVAGALEADGLCPGVDVRLEVARRSGAGNRLEDARVVV